MAVESTKIQEPGELEQLQSFLASNKLPYKDITLNGNFFLLYYDNAGAIVGSGGIEIYDDLGLIRSVAVNPSARGKRLGMQIVDDLVLHAKQMNLQSLFLLTETAHDFFLKKGFQDFSREKVPSALKASSEFSFLCPASAKCMVYKVKHVN